MTIRQQVLYLWLAESALDSQVVAWAFHDGTRGVGPGLPEGERPFETGAAALHAGWLLLQSAVIAAPVDGQEYDTGYLGYEFVFERRIEVDAPPDEA